MDTNDAYLAGLVDGEGCVGYHSCGRGVKRRFVIDVKMTSEPVIDWLVEHFGGQKQFHPQSSPRRDQWRWRVQRQAARDLYRRIEPMLIVKRGLV